jgi:sulfide dehydrogenase [flavocytochrome c] flavoprotein subunit
MRFWTRREFGCFAGTTCLTLLCPRWVRAQVEAAEQLQAKRCAAGRGRAKARVVVIGGGIGGATVAKYLALSMRTLDVTLVEPKPRYTTCFFSNLYLAGLRSFETLTHGYEALANKYGIRVVRDRATAINVEKKRVRLNSGKNLSYDRLVLAPGIAFRPGAIHGYDDTASQTMPHAWMAGPQTILLRRQLEGMNDGGLFVLAAPPDPFRCPPGPYERASMVAYYFKRHKPRAKILILDAKDTFFEQDLFQDAWNRHYPGMIEWLPAQFTGGIQAVDVKTRTIITPSEKFKAAVANVIPPQMAGELAQETGLADKSGWCPVDPQTLESMLRPGVHLVGDAIIGGEMPKSAFAANSQAKACAFAIAAALTGSERFAPRFFNTCFTFLGADDAVKDAASFKADGRTIKTADILISSVEESNATRARTVQEADGWYAAFTHDVFG